MGFISFGKVWWFQYCMHWSVILILSRKHQLQNPSMHKVVLLYVYDHGSFPAKSRIMWWELVCSFCWNSCKNKCPWSSELTLIIYHARIKCAADHNSMQRKWALNATWLFHSFKLLWVAIAHCVWQAEQALYPQNIDIWTLYSFIFCYIWHDNTLKPWCQND